jgi:UDP-N-acetylglucosamine diphosphorylase/glucosamine-1-phosphate N-acetyltransferase
MTNAVLFDFNRRSLLPFTFTRPTSEIRVGIWTIKEHWEAILEQPVSYLTEEYLNGKFPVWKETENLFLNGNIIPDAPLINAARELSLGQRLVKNGTPLAAYAEGWPDPLYPYGRFRDVEFEGEISIIRNLWDIFNQCGIHIQSQFHHITKERKSQPLSPTNRIIGNGKVFIEEGAKVECSIFNTEAGPIYIGKNAEVMEGCLIRGPFVLAHHATLKMGAKIYGPTVIGPHCKVGGEVNNSVFFGYSNKAHDGFIGNSVIGEWCNLGADTNNSNLKNNYSEVNVHSIESGKPIPTGLKFCGVFMGDHAKCGINTMLNTGTVIGIGANIFGSGFPPKYVPSFSWGGLEGSERFQIEKAVSLAKEVFSRRSVDFDQTEETLMRTLYELTKSAV